MAKLTFSSKPPSPFRKKRKNKAFNKRQILTGKNKTKKVKIGKVGAAAPAKTKPVKTSKTKPVKTKKVKDPIVLDPTGAAGVSSVTGARFEDQSLKTKETKR